MLSDKDLDFERDLVRCERELTHLEKWEKDDGKDRMRLGYINALLNLISLTPDLDRSVIDHAAILADRIVGIWAVYIPD